MKTNAASADKLGRIIRSAGLESPDIGLTDRIMNRIEVATIKKIRVYKPVIARRGWVLIVLSVMAFLILTYFLQGVSGNDAGISHTDTPVLLGRIRELDLSLHFNFQVSTILLLGLTVLLFWIVLDYLVATRRWKRHTLNRA